MSQSLELSDKRVLIIDDQKPFQVMLKGLLLNLGAKDVVAKNTGESGIAAHQNQPFDILLVDYNLGSGKNGRQVLEELRVRNLLREDTVFFLITGDNSRPMVLSAVELQPDDYLMKPFSHRVLRTRLLRAFAKRKQLRQLYRHLLRQEYTDCIAACQSHIESQGHYTNFCIKLQAELYNNIGQYDDAERILEKLLEEQRFSWGLMALARTRFAQQRYNEAIELASEVLKKSPHSVEAQDLITQCYLHADTPLEALESARKAINLAPFSIERQSTLAQIARENGEFELAKQAMHHVLEISRKSVYRDARHLCAYIRSILDAAEHGEDRSQVSKYQTEATLALQRARFDDNLVYSELSYEQLEDVVMARIEAFNGRYREAQRHLNTVVGENLAEDQDIAAELMPDVLAVLLDVGEYEKANELAKRSEQQHNLDHYSRKLLNERFERAENRQKSFFNYNQEGINAYKQRDYGEAVEQFTQALKLAPMNSGAALNYIQAAAKIFGATDSPNPDLLRECKRCFRVLEGIALNQAHQQRYDRLLAECRRFGV
ncbi:tetratricopeptide repeat-containing response regulator [Idiomarina xiamenensis]|uniref:TPR repeat-containing response regulator n=1 Tax=Idiomarina xiamenensis 10-D-4 TaxID=740709 RepID=K2KAI0_9GAMM|nr:tetratricopeptide repeat-containing response regulator [Idiomarina xiamenensis]EKE84833.1 TPR repeat-containing response regulator [Idiomarina xiamenensis 10-D-4]